MAGSLSPLKHKSFAFLWLAALVSNIGTWMHEVGAGWLMTELSDNPLMVSLVAASTSLPVFLFVLVAGALADILDRRKYLLWTQFYMLLLAIGLTFMTWSDMMTPWLLLFFTFAIGTGAALMMPAWDAIIPELVPRNDLSQAIALGSIGINAARAIGPALAGLIIAASGSYAVFALNTVSFLGVIISLLYWRRNVVDRGMAPERFIGAIKAGIRFTRYTKSLQIVLLRSGLFFITAIALLALLPLYVREVLQGNAQVLGYLQASMGIGAILTAFVMPLAKKHLSIDSLLFIAAAILSLSFIMLSMTEHLILACIALFTGGMAWIMVFSLLRVKAQETVPNWVRARAMSVMLMVSFGSMALGSAIWGQLVNIIGLQITYAVIAPISFIVAFLMIPFSLKNMTHQNHEQAKEYHQHRKLRVIPNRDEGPIQVTIEYRLSSLKEDDFKYRIHQLSLIRKRNGAYRWHLFKDLETENVFVEQFLIEDWEEHERQHARTSVDEKTIHDGLISCLEDGTQPIVKHYLHSNGRRNHER
ncbi:MFS transporter [Curvivirga aplysinae]|uniref:MFS transporter n=1 Tax=Curvivirga aplysinae TaxID=2529852 RepID=UPI0012BBE596|nr:MFS transporter [Curvivirga aplysinae]MTI09941.1 MFS transporter [Curvivirga aplysinae]